MRKLTSELTAHRSQARALFGELARDRDPVVRAWVPWAAGRALGVEAVPIIKQLASDRDIDVRDVAVEELVGLDIEAARSLAPKLGRKLRSKDVYEPATARWALGAVRDVTAREAIQEAGDQATTAIGRNTARVVLMLLSDDPDEIVRRIRAHDHELMAWLTEGARLLGTADAIAALRECAAGAPDKECRGICEYALEKIESRSPGGM
jgi:HEAT repeat protein